MDGSLSHLYYRGLPLITYAPRGRGGGDQASYTFLLRITCKKRGGGGFQIACKIAYIINGRPHTFIIIIFIMIYNIYYHTIKNMYTILEEHVYYVKT